MNEKKCNVEVFARVTGFFRPVQSWNKGKASEFSDRKKFNIDAMSSGAPEKKNSETAKTVSG